MAHLPPFLSDFVMSVKNSNSAKWNVSPQSKLTIRTPTGTGHSESAETAPGVEVQDHASVTNSPRVAMLGRQRSPVKTALKWVKTHVGGKTKKIDGDCRSEKMGIYLPAFKRHMPSMHALRAKARELDERVNADTFRDRMSPHYAELIRLHEALSMLSKASSLTDKVALPGQRIDPASLHNFIHRLDGELAAVQNALYAQKRALGKTLPNFTIDRAWLRAVGRRLKTQHKRLQDIRQQTYAVLNGRGLSTAETQLYVDAGIPITPQTRDVAYTAGDFKKRSVGSLGKGAMHSVERVEVEANPGSNDGTLVPKVFKAEPKMVQLPEAANVTQIKNPILSCRAVATSKVNDGLGLKLIPQTVFGLLDDRLGVVMDYVPPTDHLQRQGRVELPVSEDVKVWAEQNHRDLQRFAKNNGFDGAEVINQTIVFSRQKESLVYDDEGYAKSVNGVPLKETAPADIQCSPDVLLRSSPTIAQLAAASCFNFLVNSSDAHLGNCAVGPNGVQYFDNDISFGRHSPDLDGGLGGGVDAVHLTHLPEVIPTSLHDGVMAMTPDKLKAQLMGLLGPEEIEATCDRFAALKWYCAYCAEFGKVLADDDPAWGQADVQRELGLDRIIAARGDLDRLEELGPDLARRNVPARYLLNLCVTEARTQAYVRGDRPLDPDQAVTFDPVALHADLVQLSSPATVSV
jgi:hypothetical protein